MTLLRSGLSVLSPAELFPGRFEVFDDLLGKNAGIEEIVRLVEAFVSEPENVEAGFVALDEFSQFRRKCSRPLLLHFSPTEVGSRQVSSVISFNNIRSCSARLIPAASRLAANAEFAPTSGATSHSRKRNRSVPVS